MDNGNSRCHTAAGRSRHAAGPAACRRPDQRQLSRTREPLDCPFAPERISARIAAFTMAQDDGTTTAGITRRTTGIMLCQAPNNIFCHAGIKRTVPALDDIYLPVAVASGVPTALPGHRCLLRADPSRPLTADRPVPPVGHYPDSLPAR